MIFTLHFSLSFTYLHPETYITMQTQHPPSVERDMHDALKKHFGYDAFRPQQIEIISHVMAGRDALVIMPTGGGKSLCYQLPAITSEGMTVVVSPLIALMRDQVLALRANGIAAAAINSSVPPRELAATREAIEDGKLKLLYVSPEKVTTPRFMAYLRQQHISMIAIDEAHCVSIWGNDFRPEYAALHKLVTALANVPVIALTATADRTTQRDIEKQLGLRNPKAFVSSFERKNIFIRVSSGQDRFAKITRFLERHPDEAGIVYCLSRRSTEEMAARLRMHGHAAEYYHAEVSPGKRREVQDAFQRDDIQIVCATIAFGMGIDKANIRWVIHYNMPKNVESFYQEIGRAGRDGDPSETLMFFSFRDIMVYRDFIVKSEAPQDFKDVQRQKLDRIWELAQATSCRTNVILNYFGEYRHEGCGHCDNCQNPPEGFDGTVIALKALSACKRTRQTVGMQMLTDILRGSGRRDIRELGFDKIKTFGAGRDIPRHEWLDYLTQMLNQGLLEIDYADKSRIKCTSLGEKVLKDKRTITLHKKAYTPQLPEVRVRRTTKFEDGLYTALRKCRENLAAQQDVPAYVIFADKTLREIAKGKPLTVAELEQIHGVGEFKANQYGDAFMQVVRKFTLQQSHLKRPKGRTYIETLLLLKQGMSVEEIAKHRKLHPGTIYGHLLHLYERGEEIDLRQYISEEAFTAIHQAWLDTGKSEQLSPIKERLPDEIDFHHIRFALAILQKEASNS